MTVLEAIDALRPFSPKVPSGALDLVRSYWSEAEPILLAEIDRKLAEPTREDEDALFLYAIHLCAEMRSRDAFPLFVRIARLPEEVLDHLMGDILTQSFGDMLALTCDGRIDEIKALIENPSLYEFARTMAMDSLEVLLFDNALSRDQLSAYCVELLSEKLERRPAHVWNAAISVASDLQIPGALPLIEKAYERGLADPGVEELTRIQTQYDKPLEAVLLDARRRLHPFDSTEAAMSFFVHGWGEEEDDELDDLELLDILNEQPERLYSPTQPATGRNAPCPCGSGKKYKRCCIDRDLTVAAPQRVGVMGNPIRDAHVIANDWMEAGYLHHQRDVRQKVIECWKHCWEELQSTLPAELQDPMKAEGSRRGEGGHGKTTAVRSPF